MNVDKDTVKHLLSSMQDYNPTVNTFAQNVDKVVIPIAMIILAIFWYLDFADLNRKFSSGSDDVKTTFWIKMTMTYFTGMALIMLSPQIIDAVVWLTNAIGHLIDKVPLNDSGNKKLLIPEVTKKANFWQKMVLGWFQSFANVTMWIASLTTKLLIMLRFIMLYIMKSIAPVMVAAFVNEEFRTIAIGFIKQFSALIFQGVLLLLILKLWPALVANDMFNVVAKGNFQENLAAMFMVIVKGIVIVVTLIGSQSLSRRLFGV